MEIFKANANMQYQKNLAGLLGANKGGKLILTDKQLIFKAHALNIGQKEYHIPLEDIEYSNNGFHILTPTPNMIKVVLKNGEIYKFVVNGKDKDIWKRLIMEYAMKARGEK